MSATYYRSLPKVIFLSDVVILNISLLVAQYVVFGAYATNLQTKLVFIIFNVSWLVLAILTNYHNAYLNFRFDVSSLINDLLLSIGLPALAVFLFTYFVNANHAPKELFILSFIFFGGIVTFHRTLLYLYVTDVSVGKKNEIRIAVVGETDIAETVINALSKQRKYKYCLNYLLNYQQGFITDSDEKPHLLFICCNRKRIRNLNHLLSFAHQNNIAVKIVFDVLNCNKKDILHSKHAPILTVALPTEREKKISPFLKRSFDVCFASGVLVAGFPVLSLLYIITKLTSRGPGFYIQERIGKNGKPFRIYKFRSMHTDAEKFGPQLAKDNDPRVTRWGLVMRKTRMDELPQFWNVIKGDMSVVGYRPERKCFIDEISRRVPEYKMLLSFKPGLTSLGQVHYGYAENIDQMCERLEYDLLYIESVNFRLDYAIILKTIKIMADRRGK